MFAKLKKKIEEEVGVGDLGQLASPLAAAFGGDRRVGGSSQGTNTPNNIGSRQSSLASLVDIHHDELSSPNALVVPSHSPSSVSAANRTSNSAAAAANSRQKAQEQAHVEAELKKMKTQFESMKKSYEERIQNQEADFAWKYSAKEEELEKVRAEKRKAEELIKTMEGSYHNKMRHVQDDMDQLEGYTKQEMAKVKHLLLNTQADLQKSQSDLMQQESQSKELLEENRNLKAENESILRNLDRDRLNRVKFEAEHGDTVTQIATLEQEIQDRDAALSELRGTLDATVIQLKDAEIELKGIQSVTEQQHSRKLESAHLDINNLRIQLQKLELELSNQAEIQESEIRKTQQAAEHERSEREKMEQLLVKVRADLQKAQSDLVKQESQTKDLLEESKRLKTVNETISKNLETDTLNRAKLEVEHGDTVTQIATLRQEIQDRDATISELRGTLDSTLENTESELKKLQSITEQLHVKSQTIENADVEIRDLRLQLQKLELELSNPADSQESEVQKTQQELANVRVDLQKEQSDSVQLESQIKDLLKENRSLKTENETILRNLDNDRLNRVKFEAEHGETVTKIATLQQEIQNRDAALSELRGTFDATVKQLENAESELKVMQSVTEQLYVKSQTIEKADLEISDLRIQLQKLELKLLNQAETQASEIQNAKQATEHERSTRQKVEHLLVNVQADLQKAQSNLMEEENRSKDLLDENRNLKTENETILRNLDSERLSRVKFEAEHSGTIAEIATLQQEILSRDATLSELRETLDATVKQVENAEIKLKEMQSVTEQLHIVSQKLENANLEISDLRIQLQKLELELSNQAESQESDIQNAQQASEHERREREKVELLLVNVQADLQRAQSDLAQQETLTIKERQPPINNGIEEEGDVESYKERIRELEAKLNDKNKALKLRQQQLQDLRKTLAKEMRSSSSQLHSADASEQFSKSASQNSLTSISNEVRVEEMSQTESEPAVIQSSNSHHADASRCYAEDVNFQYLKTVIFKFVTSPDPQVTQHLLKVVSTLLHLSEEESRILEKCTDKRLLTWLGSRDHHPGY